MQRISVDLPEPDGPQMTMRSPRATARSMSRSTWNCAVPLVDLAKLDDGFGHGCCQARLRVPVFRCRSIHWL